MLVGLDNNVVITGAFSGGGGACPMLAAHREGGRTSVCSFPETWDAFTGVAGRRIVRTATDYEVAILRREIEASLEPAGPSELGEAIAEYRASVDARRRADQAAEQETPVQTRRRRLRVTGGERLDLGDAIAEHKSTARSRRGREAEQVGLDWLFEQTLVLPDDFDEVEVSGEPAERELGFDSAESDLLRR
jgi:hypothetical protein